MRFNRKPAATPRPIGLTPLIDVVFILLVFFMLAADLQQWRLLSVDATVTRVGGGSATTTLWVEVHRGCTLALDGASVDLAALGTRLDGLVRQDQAPAVVVQAEAGASLQCLVTVLDRVRGAGARHVSLVGQEAP